MRLFKLLALVLGTTISLWLTIYLYEQGFLTDYWEPRASLWDPRLKIYRCLDENGQIDKADRQSPCSVMTLAGQRFGERRIAKCMAAGGNEQQCTEEAWRWVYSMRPEERAHVSEEPKGTISRRTE
jgi:hypothetical protein